MNEDIINHSHFFQPRSRIWEEELFEIFGGRGDQPRQEMGGPCLAPQR